MCICIYLSLDFCALRLAGVIDERRRECACMCVCMYVCVRVCARARACVCMYIIDICCRTLCVSESTIFCACAIVNRM